MDICKYCKDKGMTLEEYKNFKNNIKELAKAIRSQLQYNNGMYFDTKELFTYDYNEDMKCFIIQELKNLDIEFYEILVRKPPCFSMWG